MNPYLPQLAQIINLTEEAPNVRLFSLKYKKRKILNFSHGQFIMAGAPGVGEAAFDICSDAQNKDYFEICVRHAGNVTNKLFDLKKGDFLTVRGPFGTGFPDLFTLPADNLLIMAGGIGFIPFRSVFKEISRADFKFKILVLYGNRNQTNLLFKDEYPDWQKKVEMKIILDNPEVGWRGPKGLITDLLAGINLTGRTTAFLCGPPIMYKFVLAELAKKNILPDDIYLSLERRIHCGVGVCQHCAIGQFYVCQDGPVFRWQDIKEIEGVI